MNHEIVKNIKPLGSFLGLSKKCFFLSPQPPRKKICLNQNKHCNLKKKRLDLVNVAIGDACSTIMQTQKCMRHGVRLYQLLGCVGRIKAWSSYVSYLVNAGPSTRHLAGTLSVCTYSIRKLKFVLRLGSNFGNK